MTEENIERIGRLLAALPPAPEAWIAAACEIPKVGAELDGLLQRAHTDADLREKLIRDRSCLGRGRNRADAAGRGGGTKPVELLLTVADLPGDATAAGPAAAQAGSAAASVLRAAAREAEEASAAAQAAALAARLARLAVEDARALAAARASLPTTEPPRSDVRRDFALGQALDAAAAVPLAIAEACADVALLAQELAAVAEPGSLADVEAARLLAAGAAAAAAHLVEVNLVVGADDDRLVRAQAAARAAAGA
jgi:formiminotetrahydrofolate cyclodeaminase